MAKRTSPNKIDSTLANETIVGGTTPDKFDAREDDALRYPSARMPVKPRKDSASHFLPSFKGFDVV